MVRTAASYRAGLGSFLRLDVTCGPCTPSELLRFSSIHKINMLNSTWAFTQTQILLTKLHIDWFYFIAFHFLHLDSHLHTGATARAYSIQDTKCNHTLRDKAVTLTSGLFLHRRHHQDYRWSERSTALHSYLLHLEAKK